MNTNNNIVYYLRQKNENVIKQVIEFHIENLSTLLSTYLRLMDNYFAGVRPVTAVTPSGQV